MSKSYQQRDNSGYLSEDTVTAISTGMGGAIAIIRISGPEARKIFGRISMNNTLLEEAKRAYRTRLYSDNGKTLDDVVVLPFFLPNSFTGEDVIELHCHGGAYTAGRILEEVIKNGARQALPGEFSFRAVRNGKMNLGQAEAVRDLIEAKNDHAVEFALERMSGFQNKTCLAIRDELRNLCAFSELGIDFSDQDVDELSLDRLKARADKVIKELRLLLETFDRGQAIQEGVSVAIVGLPNAGKSSFFNSLCGEERSIVSDQPGTTRDVIRESVTLNGEQGSITFRFEDTAGFRDSTDVVEAMGVQRTREAARRARLIVLVVDPAADLAGLKAFWDSLEKPGQRTLGVLSKKDRYEPEVLERFLEKVEDLGVQNWICTSALSGEGISAVAQEMVRRAGRWTVRETGELVLTRQEQVGAVQCGLDNLEQAMSAHEQDLFAADVRHALAALAPLIGDTVPDDILGKIFAEFCIGK